LQNKEYLITDNWEEDFESAVQTNTAKKAVLLNYFRGLEMTNLEIGIYQTFALTFI